PRPKRSRRSKPRLPRVPAAVPSPRRARTKTWWWRKRRHKRPPETPRANPKSGATPGFSIAAGRTQGGANLLLEKEKDGEEMSRRSHNYARFAKKMKPTFGQGQQCGGTCGGGLGVSAGGLGVSVKACWRASPFWAGQGWGVWPRALTRGQDFLRRSWRRPRSSSPPRLTWRHPTA